MSDPLQVPCLHFDGEVPCNAQAGQECVWVGETVHRFHDEREASAKGVEDSGGDVMIPDEIIDAAALKMLY